MTNGIVKFFNAAKGFGFITPDGGGKDVFVPAASVTASGVPPLKPGQTVTFDTEPDAKGPKAVNLKLIAEAPKVVRETPPPPPPAPREPEQARMTLYYDPSAEDSNIVLDALDDAGVEPHLVDYIAVPPDRDALKSLSLLLRGGDQSLVRKYDSLFLELRLDDRFISDGEFWGAIVEHPTLINGPVLATAHKARVCRTEKAVRSFLGLEDDSPAAKPKGIPQAMAQAAVAVAVRPVVKAEPVQMAEVKAPERTVTKIVLKPRAEKPVAKPVIVAAPKAKAPEKMKPVAKAKPAPKAKAPEKIIAKPKAKPAAKPVKAAKAPARKPVKTVKRAGKK